MLSSPNTGEGSQTANDGVSENGSGGATSQTEMDNLSSQAGHEESLELITALGVFDPNLAFASALDIDFQDQWVRSSSYSKSLVSL